MNEPKLQPDDRERQLAHALADFVDREALGETIEIDVFCRSHPDLQPELGEQLKGLVTIDGRSSLTGRPERLSGHKIIDEIGAGGMGRVFLAMDEGLGRRVAIKTLATRYANDSQLRTRFMHEARSMARLSHSNIVRIYNLGQSGEMPHFVMEYVDGVSLTQACQPLTLRQKVEMMHKIVVAVDFLHQNHVIHRDLKPGNILVGPDLEPKLLDFGLALELGELDRLTRSGVIVGTPRYFSPEQARADSPLDARSDVFSLGTIFYELLTGVLPFRGETLDEAIQTICERDPVLPRRISAGIPGEVQNICLKALEKNPEDRYASAREMAEDIERYLAGEQPLAAPAAYSRLMSGKIERHLRELEGWRQDQIVSDEEFHALKKGYSRLIEREDAWIMETRKLTVSQVSLYLGGWLSVVGAALLVLFNYANLTGTLKVGVAAAATGPMVYLGIRCWKQGLLRIGMAFLLAFCFLLPIVLLVAMGEYGLRSGVPNGDWELLSTEFLPTGYRAITNAQFWWSFLLSLPVYLWLRRFTRSSVFSLASAIMVTLLCVVGLLRMGVLEWLRQEKFGSFFLHLIPIALLFFAIGMAIERLGYPTDSRYFYPVAVGFTWIALIGLASTHEGYLEFVNRWWSIEMQREYLFLINAGIYFLLQGVCEHLPWAQLQSVSRAFRFVIPGHVLLPILSIGVRAMDKWKGSLEMPGDPSYRFEARVFEVLLPCVACAFVYLSIPRQMKNFFVWGMVFLAIGVVQLQNELFKDHRVWLISLMLGGLLVMLAATHYATLRMTLSRWLHRAR